MYFISDRHGEEFIVFYADGKRRLGEVSIYNAESFNTLEEAEEVATAFSKETGEELKIYQLVSSIKVEEQVKYSVKVERL